MDSRRRLFNSIDDLLHGKPATWHWGRALRAAFCVGTPFAIGIATHNIMPWMWIAMGTLMMTTGERPIAYRPRIQGLLGSSLLGALGYFYGYLHLLPYGYTLLVMALLALSAGLLSQRGPNWSIGCLQLLLTASIAIGVPSINTFWWPALLYLVGAVLYVAVLGIEILCVPNNAIASTTPNTRPAIHFTPAIVLMLCLSTAYAAKYVLHASHWFWIPLTVGLIMKPDLGNIFDRSLLRCLGTVVGVLLATCMLSLFPKDLWQALFIAVLAGVLPWCMARSYALQAIALTPLVLLLVDSISPGATNINYALQRLSDTLIGAAIVMLVGYCSVWISLRLQASKT